MREPVLPTFLPPVRQRSYTELGVSALLHAALILVILSPWLRRYHVLSPNGTGVGIGGGGGGAGEQYIALPALRPAPAPAQAPVEAVVETPVVPPPVTVPTEIPPPTPVPDSVPAAPVRGSEATSGSAASGAGGTGPGSGGGTGGGQGPGSGSGVGPGSGSGERGRPPQQRQMVVPPLDGTPRELRGDTIIVRFYVDATGVVDRIETDPQLPSGSYARQFNELMRGFKFRPARDSLGAAVAGVAAVTITLSPH